MSDLSPLESKAKPGLVQRLRERAGQYDEYAWHAEIETEAADEIERLHAVIKTLSILPKPQPDLPPLPNPLPPVRTWSRDHWASVEMRFTGGPWYTADQMREYAAACVAAERERCAKLCERQAQLQIATGADDDVIAQAHRCAMVIRREKP